MIRGLCRPSLVLLVMCGTACTPREEPVSSVVQAVNSTCAHELTCTGGPLAGGSSSSGGCIPPSGNANGWCVHEVCADSAHAYCCSSTWDNGCVQFAGKFTKSAGFGYNDCPTPAQNPAPACSSGCTPKTCSQVGATCGMVSDGCGGVLSCGTCPTGQTCTGNKCGPGTVAGPGTCTHDLTCTGTALVQGCDNGSTFAGCLSAVCGYFATTHCCTSFGSGAAWDSSCVAELHWHAACKTPNPPANPLA